MPTPSGNPPSGPPSPPPYNFSTCPDDATHIPRATRETEDIPRSDENNIDELQDALQVESPQPASETGADRYSHAAEDAVLLDIETVGGRSSRDTTMSPQPTFNNSEVASPPSSTLDNESVKNAESPKGQEQSSPARLSPVHSQISMRRHGHYPEHKANLANPAVEEEDEDDQILPHMGSDFPNMRSIPICSSSFLRPGSRFHGTQQSERQVYDVQVEIKHVDMRESFLCGYLRIQGLTEDHPTLTTYFEGEIIGSKYSFFTQHEEWGANTKVDLSHWSKFSAFRPYQKQARKGPVLITDAGQREHVFMRWKEHFLVPDHRVRTISGASFEGFYYICFNQVKGEVSGIYFHARSEKFQQLELKHVPDRGCFSAQEFR